MNYDFLKDFLHKPFKDDSYGPDSFDCYGLVWYLNFHFNGIDLPRFDNMEGQVARINACIKGQAITNDWQEVKVPQDFDLVLLRRSGDSYHVGIWFGVDGGKILHATPKGVMCNDRGGMLRMGFQHINFYRIKQEG